MTNFNKSTRLRGREFQEKRLLLKVKSVSIFFIAPYKKVRTLHMAYHQPPSSKECRKVNCPAFIVTLKS